MSGTAIPGQIQGGDGITVTPEGVISSTGVEQGGSFQTNPAPISTNSLAPVLFWSAPFTLTAAGDILIELTAVLFMQNANGSATTMGAVFTADVDGAPLAAAGGVEEIDVDAGAAQGVQTWTTTTSLFGVVPALSAGPHTLNFFLQVLDADCTANTGVGEAGVHINRV